MTDETTNIDALMAERFKQLPKVVRDSITSADVQKHLRELADTHKLHLDQWGTLENEVMMTLLGFSPTKDLQANIQKEVGTDAETAAALAADISKIVFEPIRSELERQLEHPEAEAAKVSDADQMREQMLSQTTTKVPEAASAQPASTAAVAIPSAPAAVAPGTPPNTPTAAPVERAPISQTYKPGEASTERKTVHDDPYREPPV